VVAGTGVVIRSGDRCTMASIVRLTSGNTDDTTLHKEVSRVTWTITGIAVGLALFHSDVIAARSYMYC
jgi:magnesium-transporting ATPase (P-type)